MGAALAWTLAKVPLGALGVGGPVHEPGRLQRRPERLDRLQPVHRDLDVHDGLGGQARDGG